MLTKYRFLLLPFLLFMLVGCTSTESVEKKSEITISAAASLKNVLEEIKVNYEKEYQVTINLNFAASGMLSKQIEQGAPVDLFFSADEQHFTSLVEKGMMKKEDTTPLLRNELVLITPKESTMSAFNDIHHINKLAIGIPDTVPAGQYAKEALDNLNIWQDIEGKIITAKDVRQVLSYVETGNVDAGIVYKTDAYTTDKVKKIATIDSSLHSPIIYPVGIVAKTKNFKESKKFFDYLKSENSLKLFEKYGFKVVD